MIPLKKIRVLETIRQGKVGGGETHVLDLVEELDKERYEPVVLSFTDGPMVDRLARMGVRTHVIPTERPFDYTKWKEVKTLLQDEKIDVVHAHGTRANSNVFWPSKSLRLPLIYTVHGWSFHADQAPLIKLYRTLGEKFLLRNATQAVCVSLNNYKDGADRFNMQHACIIRNGINLSRFNPEVCQPDVRKELGIGKETVLVGFVARMTIQKDPCTLLRALARIPKEIDLRLLLIGEGDLQDETVRLAHELEIEDRVIFSGFRQDVPAVLQALDIYCLPSLWEGLPIGLLEAMAMENAVIATAIDGTKEVIEHRVDGLLLPPQHPELLADAIHTLAMDKALRLTLARNARQKVVNHYNVQKMTRKVETLYQKVLLE
ncbi:glycosyltransferase family 4 protein [Pontibacter sp. E15-1]|uniref:glycosyltransferase family 4 protein n=1 Tax=Pontibacter sp. E15-1 TaxID=2919918 RepID=UPI001F502B0D|nr:glycosyltransferase family 4 protein [Pontibacter sp. E15-1]MCJ8163624.1 glycosyltransferase family 4 protein [Pontibacter sp. E15-1]